MRAGLGHDLGCTLALSVTYSTAAVFGLWRYTSTELCLCLWYRKQKNSKKNKCTLTPSIISDPYYFIEVVMILYLFALITVVLVYCVLSIVVILINIILVMCDIDYYYYSYSIYVATLYIELDLIYCLRAIAASLL